MALRLLLPRRFGTFGLCIDRLPVATEEAYELGVDLWGHPKLLAKVSFQEREGGPRCLLGADDRRLLTLEVERLSTREQALDYYSCTINGGELLWTHI